MAGRDGWRSSLADSDSLGQPAAGEGAGPPTGKRGKVRARSEARAAAARNRGRLGRVLQRRLTEWAWDDSADALQELTMPKQDSPPVCQESSR